MMWRKSHRAEFGGRAEYKGKIHFCLHFRSRGRSWSLSLVMIRHVGMWPPWLCDCLLIGLFYYYVVATTNKRLMWCSSQCWALHLSCQSLNSCSNLNPPELKQNQNRTEQSEPASIQNCQSKLKLRGHPFDGNQKADSFCVWPSSNIRTTIICKIVIQFSKLWLKS